MELCYAPDGKRYPCQVFMPSSLGRDASGELAALDYKDVAGFHDPLGRAKWREEYQAEALGVLLSDFMDLPRISGTYIWQFADVPVAQEWAMKRPKSENNKGVVDRYRRPKLAYFTVRENYRGLKR